MSLRYDTTTKTYLNTPKDDPRDRIEIEVGDSKRPDFVPQLKVMRWDNEVNVSLRLKEPQGLAVAASVSKEGETINWVAGNISAKIYAIEDGHEFEIDLAEKPASNTIEFTIEDKGVEYFYQPALTQEEIAAGNIRPDNVVGSYAIYASEDKANYEGGKLYRAGKIGHIYRPRIEDSAGNWTWGELQIENKTLSVAIPQEFLDSAVYPVKHAAGLTFGYTTAGASNGTSNADELNGYRFTGAAGTATGISMVGFGTFKRLILKHSDHTILSNGITSAGAVASTTAFAEATFGTNPTISAEDYDICLICDGLSTYFYDTGTTDYRAGWLNDYDSPYNPTVGGHSGSDKYSIYVTYTAASAGAIVLRNVIGMVMCSD